MGSLGGGGTELAATCMLLALLSPVPGARGSAGAQTLPDRPPNTPEAYVILGLTRIDVSNSISLATGSIGVNRDAGQLQGNNTVTVNQQDGVIAASTASARRSPVRRSRCDAAAASASRSRRRASM